MSAARAEKRAGASRLEAEIAERERARSAHLPARGSGALERPRAGAPLSADRDALRATLDGLYPELGTRPSPRAARLGVAREREAEAPTCGSTPARRSADRVAAPDAVTADRHDAAPQSEARPRQRSSGQQPSPSPHRVSRTGPAARSSSRAPDACPTRGGGGRRASSRAPGTRRCAEARSRARGAPPAPRAAHAAGLAPSSCAFTARGRRDPRNGGSAR